MYVLLDADDGGSIVLFCSKFKENLEIKKKEIEYNYHEYHKADKLWHAKYLKEIVDKPYKNEVNTRFYKYIEENPQPKQPDNYFYGNLVIEEVIEI